MWKRDEAVKPTSGLPATPATAASTQPVSGPAAVQPDTRRIERDIVNIGKSVVIKGELNGSEDLTIEGHVEGRIELKDHVLTIGPNGKIKAQVFAKAVIVLGEVNGNVTASRKGGHPRRRLGRRRHHLAARGDCRGCALPRQRRHAAQGCAAGPRPAEGLVEPAAREVADVDGGLDSGHSAPRTNALRACDLWVCASSPKDPGSLRSVALSRSVLPSSQGTR